MSGKIVYSLQRDNRDVLVDLVQVKAQAVGGLAGTVQAMPSTDSPLIAASGANYSLPLFTGNYHFLAERAGHTVVIETSTPGYDPTLGTVDIRGARDDIRFIDTTTRQLTVNVVDSGGNPITTYPAGTPNAGQDISVTVSGKNGLAQDQQIAIPPGDSQSKFVADFNPGEYTVTIAGASPETEEVNLTGGDGTVTMTIPVPIILQITSNPPKLLDPTSEFEAAFPDLAGNMPEGFMFYYPPNPRPHTYVLSATANGPPVEDFTLTVVDNIKQLTTDAAEPEQFFVSGSGFDYETVAGIPNVDRTVNPPVAGPKTISFEATKDGYLKGALTPPPVFVLGDVPTTAAPTVVSVPVVNYLVLHDPAGDQSYAFFEDTQTVKGVIRDMKIRTQGGQEIPVYPSPWSQEQTIDGVDFETDPDSDTEFQNLRDRGLLGARDAESAFDIHSELRPEEQLAGAAAVVDGALGIFAQLLNISTVEQRLNTFVQYEISPNRRIQTPAADTLTDQLGPGKGDVYFGEGWTLGIQEKLRLGIQSAGAGGWVLFTPPPIATYDILARSNQYIYTIRNILNIIKTWRWRLLMRQTPVKPPSWQMPKESGRVC